MKCEIIKDLLPSYIEGLTSNHSNEEIEKHLENCKECKTFHQEMTGEIKEKLPATEVEDLDFLKKVRKNNIQTAALAAGSVAVVLLILVSLFAVGFSVSSKDMDMTYQLTENHLEITFQLKNGHDLTRRSEKPRFVYDDEHKVIGIEDRYRPVWVFNNPFDDVGSSFSLGTEIPKQDSKKQFTNTLIIEYSDKTVKFVNGVLVE
ncbi:MAG: zf-HC2 domain-containing protein [Desulfitobacteriaceae bacterium]